MAVNLKKPDNKDLHPIAGIILGTSMANLKNEDTRDLLIISLPEGATVTGVFTTNQFCAAPVIIARKNLKLTNKIRALIINTGSANAGMGDLGLNDSLAICEFLASKLNIKKDEVLPFSTGEIMKPLPVEKIKKAIPSAIKNFQEDNWLLSAESIMTTDTIPKATSRKIKIQGQIITVTGISKGSGMIHPNMATMLAFIGMDINIAPNIQDKLIEEVTQESFNCISVDGDTSTNDSFVLISTNKAKNKLITEDSVDYKVLKAAVLEVAKELAQAIIKDGEGASKFITIKVVGAQTYDEAKEVAMGVACSSLVKTAFFASDANLGRVLSAIGNCKLNNFDVENIDISLNNILFAERGSKAQNYHEDTIQTEMKKSEILLTISLRRGDEQAVIWTSDLSHEYVKINSEYRT